MSTFMPSFTTSFSDSAASDQCMSAILPWLQRNKIWLHPALEVREDEGELSVWLREEWQYVPLRTVGELESQGRGILRTSCNERF